MTTGYLIRYTMPDGAPYATWVKTWPEVQRLLSVLPKPVIVTRG